MKSQYCTSCGAETRKKLCQSCGVKQDKVHNFCKNCGKPLKQLKLKPNVLLASITHGMDTQIPGGNSTFTEGDTVVVVTSGRGILKSINDIFA